jgi:hypothetical protein
MNELIIQHRIGSLCNTRQQSDIRRIPTGKQQTSRGLKKRCTLTFRGLGISRITR